MAEQDSLTAPGAVKSVGKALSIVEELAAAGRAVKVSELSRRLELSTSVVSRLLSTMSAKGWVEKEASTGHYLPGPALLVSGMSALGRREVDLIAMPILIGLSNQLNLYVSLATYYAGVTLQIRVGTMVNWQHKRFLTNVTPIHVLASGKLLASQMPWQEVEAVIEAQGMEAYTPNTVSDLSTFRAQLEVIKERGFSVEEGEVVAGYRHYATPIYDQNKNMIAAISSGGPTDTLSDSDFENMLSQLQFASRQVSDAYANSEHSRAAERFSRKN